MIFIRNPLQFLMPYTMVNEERMKYLTKLPDIVIAMYCSIHGIKVMDRDTNIMKLSVTQQSIMEKYADCLVLDQQGNMKNDITEYGLNRLFTELEICPPKNISIKEYIIDCLSTYTTVFINPIRPHELDILKSNILIEYTTSYLMSIRMTDKQILSVIGVIPSYTTRRELIGAACKFLCGIPIFCIPLTVTPCNNTTYLMNNITEVPTICYGYRNDIRAIEEEEFLMNIEEHPYGRLIMRIPGQEHAMTKMELRELETLITCANMFPNLASRLKLIISKSYPEVSELREEIEKYTMIERSDIIKFLSILFDTGLAMRGWKPGDEIPYTKENTFNPPDELTSEYLMKLMYHYESMNSRCKYIVDSLLMYKMKTLSSTVLMERVRQIIHEPEKVNSCIRVNSRFFIETAYIYLDELLDCKLDNFNIDSLEYIE